VGVTSARQDERAAGRRSIAAIDASFDEGTAHGELDVACSAATSPKRVAPFRDPRV
jgi:hypothetical protein